MFGVDLGYSSSGTLSDNVLSLITSSWSAGTKKQYKPYINKWCKYCVDHGIDPVKPPIHVAAEFLAEIFHTTKLEYSALNTIRSAMSAVIEPVNGITFGRQPLIKRILRGVFKERPSLPKYVVTYDVDIVFRYILKQPPLSSTDLKSLSFRVSTLLCILSGQRSQTLGVLDKDYMHLVDDKCIFFIRTVLKQSRPGFHQEPLDFKIYPQNESLCPVANIRAYLEATKNLRGDQTGFFISYVPPHKTVTSSTIARWVASFLRDSGINTTVFSTHSTRSASSSKSLKNGLSLADIGKAAGWSRKSTFRKSYNRPVIENFGEKVLSSF